ncbi:LOW QUALITY PROTEIN: uncharacterized protein LKV04_007410, partial [Tautogolabrus adspersus]
IVYCLAFVLGVLGNGVVIWVTGFKIRSVNTIWFLNLAVADFLFTAFLPLMHHTSSFRDIGPSYNNDDTINCFNNFAFSDDYETPSVNSCLNPLLYVFMGQDFKDKVRKSILNVLETAFQEEVCRSYTCTNSMITSRSKEKSVSDAEV